MRLEKRILIADDDATIRTLIHRVLRRRGWTSDVARDGVEALERLGECRYALLILDLMMPRMSGYELLDRVAEIPATRRPVVLLLTAGNVPKQFDPAVVAGLVQKPFDIELLLDTVTGCLDAMEPAAQLDSCSDPPPSPADASGEAN